MTEPNPTGAPSENSPERLAVSEYFASDRFVESSNRSGRYPTAPDDAFGDEPALFGRGIASLVMGLVGLSVIMLGFGVLMPLELEVIEEFIDGQPTFSVMGLIIQSVFFPPMAAFGFATVIPMFWHGSVTLRFLMATLSSLPGLFGFLAMLEMTNNLGPDDFYREFAAVMLSYFIAIALVALPVQMWSPWTLTHARLDNKPLPPLGIRAFIELTAIAAVGYVLVANANFGEVLVGILFFSGMGMLSSACIIASLIAYFLTGRQRSVALAIALLFAFGTGFLTNAFFAVQDFGWDAVGLNLILICATSLYGTVVIVGLNVLCLYWLRRTGWRCINRKSAKAAEIE